MLSSKSNSCAGVSAAQIQRNQTCLVVLQHKKCPVFDAFDRVFGQTPNVKPVDKKEVGSMQPEEPEDDAEEDDGEPEDDAEEDEALKKHDDSQDHEEVAASPPSRPRAPIVIPAGAEFLRSIAAGGTAGKTKAPATSTAAGE